MFRDRIPDEGNSQGVVDKIISAKYKKKNG